jgi:hypothetical protein
MLIRATFTLAPFFLYFKKAYEPLVCFSFSGDAEANDEDNRIGDEQPEDDEDDDMMMQMFGGQPRPGGFGGAMGISFLFRLLNVNY